MHYFKLWPALGLLLALTFCHKGSCQYRSVKFESLTKEDGLSSSEVTAIVQDHNGYMWIGTTDGLNRYDGYSFKVYRHDPQDSLSLCDNSITALFVDSKGILWVGTENNGLSKYDPLQDGFHHYAFDLSDPHSLSYNYVTSIAEDADQNLWVGTLMGLNRYVEDADHFERRFRRVTVKIKANTLDSLRQKGASEQLIGVLKTILQKYFPSQQQFTSYLKTMSGGRVTSADIELIYQFAVIGHIGNHIRAITPDEDGKLWIGFETDGLACYDHRTGKISRFASANGLNNEVTGLCIDGPHLWIGTRTSGLSRMDIYSGRIRKYAIPWASPHIKTIFKDSQGEVWIGNDAGLGKYLPGSDSFLRYAERPYDEFSLLSNTVVAIYEDMQRNLWIGSYQGGVNIYKPSLVFDHYKKVEDEPNSLSKSSVSAILSDSRGNLWVGYYSGGIDLWRKDRFTRERLNPDPENPNRLGEGTVFDIFEDSRKNIWVATYQGGLQKVDQKDLSFISFRHNPLDSLSIGGNDVRKIAEDKRGNIWAAVHGGGINKLNSRTGKFTRYKTVYPDWERSLANDWTFTIFCDSRGRIWAGTVNGVSMMDPESGAFKSFNKSTSSLSHNNVRCIFEDDAGNIWIGADEGLNRYNEQTNDFEVHPELAKIYVKGLLQDAKGNLWISSNSGLTRFNRKTGSIKNYDKTDGLQSDEFFAGACCHGADGNLYFGGKNGISAFNPGRIKQNDFVPPVYITGFKVFNKNLPIDRKKPAGPDNPVGNDQVILNHKQNLFNIEFAAINFISPEKNQYAYMLEGFEKQWNDVGEKREATYTNLDPGEYQFRVKASNNDGVWNEAGSSLTIVIRPPLWKTPWAYLLYLAAGGFALFYIRKAVVSRIRARHRIEMDEMKIGFFANITHEFKTPLTLILGPLNSLIRNHNLNGAQRNELYGMMHRNTRRLQRLINQLMEIYELDAGFQKLRVSQGSFGLFVQNISDNFRYKAEKKRLHYHFSSACGDMKVYFDHDKVEKILYNLLSNAIKFTPDGGAIALSVSMREGKSLKNIKNLPGQLLKSEVIVEITVEDSGMGIPDEALKDIFQKFYYSQNQDLQNKGSGIGLFLTQQLVQAHRGAIEVESGSKDGTRFTVWLPVSRDRYHREEISEIIKAPRQTEYVGDAPPLSENFRKPDQGTELPVVLLVEDSPEMRDYIRVNLQENYDVREAENGAEGLDQALNLLPDIIISDIMMPRMDGIGFCEKIKSNPRTNHIPVVLLTALSDYRQQISGFESGADAYIGKPFNISVLQSILQNLIRNRSALREKYGSGSFAGKAGDCLDKEQARFIQKLTAIVEDCMSDFDFCPDLLAAEAGISRAALYRKVKEATGQSVSLFIRNVRLVKASRLMAENGASVNQASLEVGFKDPAYFARCFKKHFSITPSEFIQDPTVNP